MNTLVPIDQSRQNLQAPTRMRERMESGRAISDNFSQGAGGGFMVLSIRASKFHIRTGQDEKTIPDPATGYPANYLDVVLVNASKQLAKAFYVNAYSQGNADQPDCWSMDSIRPDPSVQKKVHPTCGDCPMNAFGSKITPDGKQAKACSDHRRVAITFPQELGKPDPTPLLLRIPQSSLRNLRNYVDTLARNGYEPGGCVTRLSFDPSPSFPKLEFRFVGPLTDQEFGSVEALMNGPNTKAMLQGMDMTGVDPAPDQAAKVGLQQIPRQSPIQVTGFGQGAIDMDNEPAPQQRAPVQEPTPWVDRVKQEMKQPVQQSPVTGIITLPDGKKFDTATGQYVVEPVHEPEPVLDPSVIKLPDGKFFNTATGAYVTSPYVGGAYADTAPAQQPAQAPAEPVKKKRRSSAEVAAEKAAKGVGSAPVQQDSVPQANGHVAEAAPVDKPGTVVAASPKLENLLAGLAPKKN